MSARPDPTTFIEMRLPLTNRGALSRAWYDALHLGRDATSSPMRASAIREARQPALARAKAPHSRAISFELPSRPDARARRTPAAIGRGAGGGRAERRRQHLIQPAPKMPAPPRTLRLSVGRMRVHVLVRSLGGARVDVLAVCSARHGEFVRRALGRVAEALRSRGRTLSVAIVPLGTEAGS